MNKNDLDNLFRDKLGHHEMTPRPEAWSKLKGNLDGGRKKGLLIYWRAAAIIVVALGSLLFLYKTVKINPDPVAKNVKNELVSPEKDQTDKNNPKEDILISQSQKSALTDPIQDTEEVVAGANKNNVSLTQISVEQESLPSQDKKNENTLNERSQKEIKAQGAQVLIAGGNKQENTKPLKQPILKQPKKDADIAAVQNVSQAPLEKSENQDVNSMEQLEAREIALAVGKGADTEFKVSKINTDPVLQKPNITITFKKDSETKSILAQNEKEVKAKKFGFKTVINFAKEIKNGDLGISDLRAKKDELLARNFNKKKNVKNSK